MSEEAHILPWFEAWNVTRDAAGHTWLMEAHRLGLVQFVYGLGTKISYPNVHFHGTPRRVWERLLVARALERMP